MPAAVGIIALRTAKAVVLVAVAAILFRRRRNDPVAAMLASSFLLWTISSSVDFASASALPVMLDRTRFLFFALALIREIPDDERLILIEDTPELRVRHDNVVGLIAARSQLGESAATSEDLLNASLRMRPDRIILGEIRGWEAFTFLRAINTGHPGSMTTIHADSPDRAIEQLALLVLQTGTQLRRKDVIDYVSSVIDLFVQLDRSGGSRGVAEVRIADHLAAGVHD